MTNGIYIKKYAWLVIFPNVLLSGQFERSCVVKGGQRTIFGMTNGIGIKNYIWLVIFTNVLLRGQF